MFFRLAGYLSEVKESPVFAEAAESVFFLRGIGKGQSMDDATEPAGMHDNFVGAGDGGFPNPQGNILHQIISRAAPSDRPVPGHLRCMSRAVRPIAVHGGDRK